MKKCPSCKGRGTLKVKSGKTPRGPYFDTGKKSKCPYCDGTGYVSDNFSIDGYYGR